MNTESEALRLADALEISSNHGIRREAAAELRRLHEAHDWQYRMAGERLRRIEKLERQRDALLEALKGITPPMPPIDAPCHYGLVQQEKCAHCRRIANARAAIAAEEEGK